MLPVFLRLVCGVLFAGIFVVVGVGHAESETTLASWYGPGFEGLPTASGEPYDPYGYTAAHKTLPFGTELLVSYGAESVEVTVNDRGPFVGERELDLSQGAADALGFTRSGVDYVNYSYAGGAALDQYDAGGAAFEQYEAGGVADEQYQAGGAAFEQYNAGGAGYDQYAPAVQAGADYEQYGHSGYEDGDSANAIAGNPGLVEDQSNTKEGYMGSAGYEQYVYDETPASAVGNFEDVQSYVGEGYVGSAGYESAGYGVAEIHVVSSGETLSGIAAELGTTVEHLAAASGVANPDLIYPGQILYY